MNPIARPWGLMHRNVTHNKCFAACGQFADATRDFLRGKVAKNRGSFGASVAANFRVRMIARAAKIHGVPEAFVDRIVRRESRYHPRLTTHCFGLMQIKYATARGMG